VRLPYNVHKINIGTNREQFTPEYLKINPNGKIRRSWTRTDRRESPIP
jgi:hypothetical protein